MTRPYLGEQNYQIEGTLSTAGTAELLGTFDMDVTFILITYASLACFIGKTEAVLASAGDGSADGRIYIPAAGSNLLLPWSGDDVYFINATAAETPALYIVGIV